jgi:hypothetical protein
MRPVAGARAPATVLALASAGLLVASSGVGGAAPKPSDNAKPKYPWKSRVASAREFARGRSGSVSFAVIGERGNLRGYKPRREFASASVVKAMLMVSYLRRNDVRHRPLHAGDKALLAPMIQRSDNATATAVFNIVGIEGLLRLARAAEMRDFHPNVVWGLSQISAGDQAGFFFRLRRYIPRRHRHYAFHLLSHIVTYQSWGIPRSKPPGWEVYFKGGFIPVSGGWRINQVARLTRGSHRLGLAVLSQGNPSLEYGAETVQGVAARLLRDYNKFHRSPTRGARGPDQGPNRVLRH